jgi:hypothetical protein
VKQLDKQEAKKHIVGLVRSSTTFETDNNSQIIVYTGLHLWSDGTIRDEAEPTLDEHKDFVERWCEVVQDD